MRSRSTFTVALLCLAFGGFVNANPTDAGAPGALGAGADSLLHHWNADDEDNICGISDLKKVTNPAKVDYDHLLERTPQVKEMKRKKIDPDSTEGKALRKGARTLITKTSELVREAKGHCSVWKVISHKDGRKIPDVTDDVLDRF